MARGKVILSPPKFDFTLKRLCHQLIENYDDFDGACIVGIQDSGAILSDRIVSILKEEMNVTVVNGKLDISFYRDDYRRRDNPISPSPTIMDFLVEDKKVILVDDVLYTGRTIHAAMSALQQFGRPKKVELLVFVDRRFNRHLPIMADYKGITVDAIDEAYVKVEWSDVDNDNRIKFYSKKTNP
jgi:pyrimidine operon attenuation protein/uracil phosphoribosyltransferase